MKQNKRNKNNKNNSNDGKGKKRSKTNGTLKEYFGSRQVRQKTSEGHPHTRSQETAQDTQTRILFPGLISP